MAAKMKSTDRQRSWPGTPAGALCRCCRGQVALANLQNGGVQSQSIRYSISRYSSAPISTNSYIRAVTGMCSRPATLPRGVVTVFSNINAREYDVPELGQGIHDIWRPLFSNIQRPAAAKPSRDVLHDGPISPVLFLRHVWSSPCNGMELPEQSMTRGGMLSAAIYSMLSGKGGVSVLAPVHVCGCC